MHPAIVAIITSCIFLIQSTLATLVGFSNSSSPPYTNQWCSTDGHLNTCCVPLDIIIGEDGFNWWIARVVVFSDIDGLDPFTAVYPRGAASPCEGEMVTHRTSRMDWMTASNPSLRHLTAGSALAADVRQHVPMQKKFPDFMVSGGVRYEYERTPLPGVFRYKSATGGIIYGREFRPLQNPLGAVNSTVSAVLSTGASEDDADITEARAEQ